MSLKNNLFQSFFPLDKAHTSIFSFIVFAWQQRILLSAVNLCKQRPRSDPTERWPNLIQTVNTLIVSIK